MQVVRFGVAFSLTVTEEDFEGTPHEGFDCIECHTDMIGIDDFPHAPRLQLPDCGACHEDAQSEFIDGFFQPLVDKGYTSIPTCADCHGKHKITWQGQPRQGCDGCHQNI